MNNKEIGMLGEELAVKLLENKGYKILERNYATKPGEIDIIAINGRVIIFTEVKTRISSNMGKGREAVNDIKQSKIRKAAEIYLMRTQIPYDYCEFHVIEVSIEHIENCF